MSAPRIEKRFPAYEDLRRHALYPASEVNAALGLLFSGVGQKNFSGTGLNAGNGPQAAFSA
jgi:hypothetical protein